MAGAWKKYTDSIDAELGYIGTWLPSGEIALGDIGLMEEKRTLVRQLSIVDLELSLEVRKGKLRRDHGITSGAEIEVRALAGAEVPVHPGLDAGGALQVDFKTANAIVMRAEDCRADQCDRLDRLKQEILALNARGEWNLDWLVVTEVVRATRLLVLIAKSKGASVTLGISAGIDATAVSLAEGQGRVSLLRGSNSVYEVKVEDATPLYRAVKVRERILGEPQTKQANKRGRARAEAGGFDVVEFHF